MRGVVANSRGQARICLLIASVGRLLAGHHLESDALVDHWTAVAHNINMTDLQYIDRQHIREIIAAGDASVVPVDINKSITDHINSLAWQSSGSRLDAGRFESSDTLDWIATDDDDVVRIGKHSHVLGFYSPDSPCLLCELEFGFRNLDVLLWGAAGTRFLIGADTSNNAVSPCVTDFIECDGRRLLGVY